MSIPARPMKSVWDRYLLQVLLRSAIAIDMGFSRPCRSFLHFHFQVDRVLNPEFEAASGEFAEVAVHLRSVGVNTTPQTAPAE